ncbi:MAG: hypothetical protein J0653_00010, partial [Deltaproteobacteria bacterium]|nr:hypothetical protein [Deltaproteobacteria bacterium]
VKEALGFKKERGDTVSVANAPFSAIDRNDSEMPIWKDPEILSLLKELFKYAAIASIVAYLILKVIKPLIKTMLEAAPRRSTQTLGGNVSISDDGVPLPP